MNESAASVAALYDVHGNLPALEAVLRHVAARGIGHIAFGGDLVLGPMPAETLLTARRHSGRVAFIRGNCDRLVVAAADGLLPANLPKDVAKSIAWCADQLSPDDIAFLRALPESVAIEVDTLGLVRFVHATARSDEELFTIRTADDRAAEMFGGVAESTVVCGHTHMQFERNVGALTILNAGSVGMPYGEPGAYWCEVSATPAMHKTAYDLQSAAARVRRTEYPGAEEFASRDILAPQSRERMLTALTT
jgi:predicted phosphodiesterase